MTDRIPSSLKQRIFAAGGWTVAGFGLSQALRFGTSLLMTRLLVPEMFGVMAIANMVLAGLAMFSDIGLRQNVVQSKRGNDAVFLDTAWRVQILRGVVLCLAALGISLLLALANRLGIVPADSVYADSILPYVIAVASISAVIMGLESTKLLQAARNLSLRRVTQIEIGSQLLGVLCMLAWVAIDRSIWALVAGSLCMNLARTILTHTSLPGESNRWHWDETAWREIIGFGKWIFASSILGFLVNNGDRLLLGGLVNPTVLGVYTIAFLIVSTAEAVLTRIIGEVSFPALSEIARERPERLKSSYYRFHVMIASCAYFCSGILMISGQALIGLLYDSRYSEAGWMMEILAAALLTIPFRLATQCFTALGMPRLLSNVIAIRLVTLFALTPIGLHFFGLQGALWGIVLSSFSTLPITIFYQIKYRLFDMRKELLLLPVVLAGVIVGKVLNLASGY